MPASLRIAILLNPFTLRRKGGDHAPRLARELLGRGHTVRGFGAAPGTIPRSSPNLEPGDAEPFSLLSEDGLGPRAFAPDAVIAYDALSPAAWLGARTSRSLRVPLILVDAGSRSDERWRGRVLHSIGQALWGRMVRHTAGAFVALDPIARERALRRGFAPERVSILPSGVDLAVWRPGLTSALVQRHHLRGRILLYSGEIARDRGLEILIEAFARTVGQRDDWSLVLAGDGAARPMLRAMIDRLGIASRVHWLGRPREEELPGLFSASTLLAVPALGDDVRGLSIPRAMACGVPVLASDRTNLRSLVEPDGSGLLAPSGDLAAWTEMLRRASMSPEARRRWSRRARELAETRLAWPRVAEVFESLILRASGEVVPDSAQLVPVPGLDVSK